jgi:hypothetical protein
VGEQKSITDRVKGIARSPGLYVDLIEIEGIETKTDGRFELVYMGSRVGIGVSEKAKAFAEGLKPGDKVIAVFEDNMIRMMYGPVDEKNLYLP